MQREALSKNLTSLAKAIPLPRSCSPQPAHGADRGHGLPSALSPVGPMLLAEIPLLQSYKERVILLSEHTQHGLFSPKLCCLNCACLYSTIRAFPSILNPVIWVKRAGEGTHHLVLRPELDDLILCHSSGTHQLCRATCFLHALGHFLILSLVAARRQHVEPGKGSVTSARHPC